jgi:hypothetical protein
MINEFWTHEEVTKLPSVRPCGINVVRAACSMQYVRDSTQL